VAVVVVARKRGEKEEDVVAEILLKLALNTNQSINLLFFFHIQSL
jgi:hypothetical protein